MTKRKRGRPRKNAETPIAEQPRLTKYLVFGISIKPRHVEAHSLKVDRVGNLVFERDERVVGLFPGGTFAVEDEPGSASHDGQSVPVVAIEPAPDVDAEPVPAEQLPASYDGNIFFNRPE